MNYFKVFLYGVTLLVLAFSQNNLTLEEAIEIAMNNSPAIRQSKLNLERSRELLNAENARLKSNFSLNLTPFYYNKDRTFQDYVSQWYNTETKQSSGIFTISQPIKWTDATFSINNRFSYQDHNSWTDETGTPTKTFDNRLYLSLEQPLFTYNRTMLQIKELELDYENATLNFNIQQLAIEQQVAQSFYSVYQQDMSLQISQEEYENQKNSHAIIKNKVDAGLAAMEEFYQAELNLANSNLQLQNAQVTLDNQLDQLKILLGIPIEEEIKVVEDISHQAVEVNLDQAIQFALNNRMELRQYEMNIQNAYHNLTRTKALNEFRGSLSLTYGIIGNDEKLDNIYQTPTKNEQLSLSFNIPLYDWGERNSRIKASEATIQAAKWDDEDFRNNIVLNIRSAYRQLQQLLGQIEIERQNVRNAQLTYDINLERYANGDLTSIDLNLIQNQLSQSKINQIASLIQYRLGLLDMKVLTLYDFRKNEPVFQNNDQLPMNNDQ
jgi:outer membrane protein